MEKKTGIRTLLSQLNFNPHRCRRCFREPFCCCANVTLHSRQESCSSAFSSKNNFYICIQVAYFFPFFIYLLFCVSWPGYQAGRKTRAAHHLPGHACRAGSPRAIRKEVAQSYGWPDGSGSPLAASQMQRRAEASWMASLWTQRFANKRKKNRSPKKRTRISLQSVAVSINLLQTLLKYLKDGPSQSVFLKLLLGAKWFFEFVVCLLAHRAGF